MELTLKTDRLSLKPITEQDFDFIVKLETRPENKEYEMEGILKRDIIIEGCKEFIEGEKMLPEDGGIKYIVCNEKNEMIGSVSLSCN